MRASRIWRSAALALAAAMLCGAGVASAQQQSRQQRRALRTVSYRGYTVTVPRSWAVYDLARHPGTCVRFNRNAVYLGTPGALQRCPAHAVGRAGAILLEPVGASAARTGGAVNPPTLGGSATSFVLAAAGLRVTATWSHDRAVIARALHRRSLPAPSRRAVRASPSAHLATVRGQAASTVYTGLGFDACTAPSPKAMSAWGSSPYRAIGIYIGGTNMACSQPNLTATWLSSEAAAGWHFIPTYVGLQAPSNSCGCKGIIPSQASAEGKAAADDAVAEAQALGLAAGNPIYDDMEAYSRTGTNTSAVLAYLSAWTSELHVQGYRSGVYSSANSGITDLVAQYGTSYPAPDDIWIANWNGQQTTSDPAVPSADWQNHQRLHQYRGGHNEAYGGVTINIDNDYLDGLTADPSGAGTPAATPPPGLVVSPTSAGTNLIASWSNGTGLASWRVLAGADPSSLTMLASAAAHGSKATIPVRSVAPYFAVQAVGSSSQVLASSATVATPAHLLLYGRSAFVNAASGVGGVPAGCYLATACQIATTISFGRTVIATTGREAIGPTATGILYFKLTSRGRKLLTQAHGARLPVRVTVRNVGGPTASASLNLIPFSTSGRGPSRNITLSPLTRPVGFTDFVFARGSGGILAACTSVSPCLVAATLTVGRVRIAATRPELIGGNELGYVYFSLTRQGRAMLSHARGNQLGANLLLTCGSAVARARIALVQFR